MRVDLFKEVSFHQLESKLPNFKSRKGFLVQETSRAEVSMQCPWFLAQETNYSGLKYPCNVHGNIHAGKAIYLKILGYPWFMHIA